VVVKQGTIKVGKNEQGEIHFVLPVLAQLFNEIAGILFRKSIPVT
jgi:hypothetical protein